MSLESIKYTRGSLEILDQLLLPLQTRYVKVQGVEDGWKVINKMQVQHFDIFYLTALTSHLLLIAPGLFHGVLFKTEKLNIHVF